MSGVESLPSLAPAFFFTVDHPLARIGEKELDKIERERFKLPHHSWLLDEQNFADVYMGWHRQGLVVAFDVHIPFEQSRYPLFEDGDSLELFIDTRDRKEATYGHRFCHHFLILPVEVQGVRALEITRLRADDKRPLSEMQDVGIEVEFGKRKYSMRVDLPASCLYGFDPSVCERLGFTYRLNRSSGPPQHFTISARSCSIAQYPALWASMNLQDIKKENR